MRKSSIKRSSTIWLILIGLAAIVCSCGSGSTGPDGPPVPVDSLAVLREAFATPQECQLCHPNHFDEWQASMHAYALTDPLFFKLNDIGQARSGHRLDQFCVKCHSPLASLLQETPPGFVRSELSLIAKQGVQCDVCHTMKSFERGIGITEFRLDQVRQGPIVDPEPNAFHDSQFDNRFNDSAMCSACHDVDTPEGIQVEFTSTEWDQSPYVAMGLQCQGCHMPSYMGQAAVGGPTREVHRHTFVGVDIPLVDFPGRHETIERVRALLENSITMTITAPEAVSGSEDLQFEVRISNDRTGHSIPSGTTFERQMWIEVTVKDRATGEVLLVSGNLDANGDLLDHHSELVKSGAAAVDEHLVLFHGIPYRDGSEVLFFWEADFVENKTIPPFDSRIATYTLPGPITADEIQLTVRLRFRSLPPYLLRAIEEQELLDDLLIFEMAQSERIIRVTN